MRFTHIARPVALAGLLAWGGLSARAQDNAKQDTTTPDTTKQDAAKINAGDLPGADQIKERLSRDEYEAAWVRLFDGVTTYGWEPRGDSKWTITDQALQATGSGSVLATKTEFADFELAGECQMEAGGGATLSLRAPTSGGITAANAAQIRFVATAPAALKPDTYVVPAGKWKPFYITLDGGKLIHSPDAKGKKTELNITPRRGVIAFASTGTGMVKFRNLKLRARGFKTVFNGKDLTGWNPIAGYPSVFSVTPEGLLSIKGGPGDIQSAGVYGDFALSVDVYTNGDHLNSGVFFRVEPGKYRQGYEDQIRNQWEGDDRTKPVDFGTGAVYNRLKVRKVVSSDREWFTLTLFVSGNHIASYVDGYEVCDFTDMREANQTNARSGARTAPGTLGLQGHDPTTDVLFRNIRIVEMPAAKSASATTSALK